VLGYVEGVLRGRSPNGGLARNPEMGSQTLLRRGKAGRDGFIGNVSFRCSLILAFARWTSGSRGK
jgi:hypothetical protein